MQRSEQEISEMLVWGYEVAQGEGLGDEDISFSTIENEGILTMDKGFIVCLPNGQRFIVKIKEY